MIIIDTDFLSAFLKINKIDLVFRALETKEIVTTDAVLNEIGQSLLYEKFLELLESKENRIVVKKVRIVSSRNFGLGELECIALAEKTNSLLLMDDREAGRFAEEKGIVVMDIITFLLRCKLNSILSREEIKQIIQELKEEDYYEFNEDIKKMLLE